MNLKHSSQVKLPDLREIRDPKTRDVMDQFLRLIHDSFKNIHDDLFQLTEKMRHTVDSTTALTLTDGGVYVFSGSGAPTWTLPELSRENDIAFFIKNRGSATITLNRAGSDQLWDTAAVNSLSIAAAESYLITNDGTYWIIFDLN